MLARITNGGNPIFRLRNEMDDLFDDFTRTLRSGDPLDLFGRRTLPAVNVWEDDKTVFAEAELPGLRMEALEVLVLGDELTIKGERKAEGPENAKFHRRERGLGTLSRVLRLPVEVDAEKVEATMRDGVLSIRMPKAQAVLPRKIEIKR